MSPSHFRAPSRFMSLLLPLALLTPQAQAHGDHVHAQRNAAGPFPVEQLDFGIPGNPRKLQRTWLLELDDDERLEPAQLSIPLGSTVRLVISNSGKRPHELALGSPATLKALADARRQRGKALDESVHVFTIAPGDKDELVWEFNRAGTWLLQCLDPAHGGKAQPLRVLVQPKP